MNLKINSLKLLDAILEDSPVQFTGVGSETKVDTNRLFISSGIKPGYRIISNNEGQVQNALAKDTGKAFHTFTKGENPRYTSWRQCDLALLYPAARYGVLTILK
jgi:hypothetical protein